MCSVIRYWDKAALGILCEGNVFGESSHNHPNIWCNTVQQQRHASVGPFDAHTIDWILPLINARASEPVNVAFIWQTPTHWRGSCKIWGNVIWPLNSGSLGWMACSGLGGVEAHFRAEDLHPLLSYKKKLKSTTPFNYPSTLPFWIYFLDILSRENTFICLALFEKSNSKTSSGRSVLLWTHHYGN